LRRYITESKSVIFEGDGYSDNWVEEAEKRGLPNVKSTPLSLKAYIDEDVLAMFEKHGVMNKRESEARYEMFLENYMLNVQIESRMIGDLATNHVIPTAVKYQNTLIKNIKGLKELGIETESTETVTKTIKDISHHISQIQINVEAMTEARKGANKKESEERALLYDQEVKSFFDKIRYHVDKLELIVDDEDWPLTKYRELLMIR
jgi:glutamine synthetase